MNNYLQLPDMALRISVAPRTFHFKQPAGTSRGVYTERHVWYVTITSPEEPRLFGMGECAPLPDLSCDAAPDYGERLLALCREAERSHRFDAEALRPFPSMLFGLETACLSAQASLRGDYRRLFATPFSDGEAGIRINGLVWMGRYEEMLQRMEAKLEAGFRCVKLKIGAIDFEDELELLRRLRQRFSPADVELRVDANGAFSPSEAPAKLERLAAYGLHSIEQPIRAGQWAEMARLCRTTPLPIALDEELIGLHNPQEKEALLDEVRPQYVILKPSLHGGLGGAEEWMDAARRRGIGYWVTSALETNVGLNAIAQWTATLTDIPHTLTHGLGTGQLFTDNYDGIPLHIDGECLWTGSKADREFRDELARFRKEWEDGTPTMEVKTSGSTGTPKTMQVEKHRMRASAEATCRKLGLQRGDTALLCMPLQYIAGKMMAVRAFTYGLRLIATAPSAHPLAQLTTAPGFAAMTPMQVYETLRVPRERELLRAVRHLIIGGGDIHDTLLEELRDFPHNVWQTYGMTETLSHIALRRINTPSPTGYTPLDGVSVALTGDGCLQIDAPAVCPQRLTTNDRAEFLPDGTFRILGRRDNVVCSGGLKLQIEQLERRLRSAAPADVHTESMMLTAVPDRKYGEALVLLCGRETDLARWKQVCTEALTRYERPKHYLTALLPLTATGKPARAEAKALARRLLCPDARGTR